MALPEIFFVSEEVLEMLAELPQMPKRFFFRFAELPRGISKSAEGALHHGFDHLFDEGDLFC